MISKFIQVCNFVTSSIGKANTKTFVKMKIDPPSERPLIDSTKITLKFHTIGNTSDEAVHLTVICEKK